MIETTVKKKSIGFPRLMVGIQTGTIYLVTGMTITVSNGTFNYHTIVLSPAKGSTLQVIGDAKKYDSRLLRDFHGEVTMKGSFE